MRIYKRKNTWYIDYMYHGKRGREKIGRDKKTAELVLKDMELKIARGEHLGIHEQKKIRFDEFIVNYLNVSKANKKPQSYRRDIVSSKNLMPHFGDEYLDDINPYLIEQYRITRLNKVTPSTINREVACLRHCFTKAIEWGYAKDNPVKKVKFMKEPAGRARFLESSEINRLLLECSPWLKPIVIVALNTGMRKSEILNLKWVQVNWNNKMITITDTKNNEPKFIPMNETVYSTLRKLYHVENMYVFRNRAGMPYTDVYKIFCNAVERAGIKDFRFHDLRHTFASHLAMNGCNLRAIQQLLGHKDFQMTLRYSHLSKSHLRDSVNTLDKSFGFGTNLAQIDFGHPEKQAGERNRTFDLRFTKPLLYH
jgi:integrase